MYLSLQLDYKVPSIYVKTNLYFWFLVMFLLQTVVAMAVAKGENSPEGVTNPLPSKVLRV